MGVEVMCVTPEPLAFENLSAFSSNSGATSPVFQIVQLQDGGGGVVFLHQSASLNFTVQGRDPPSADSG